MNKKTVMVIDDEELVLQVAVALLVRGGYEAMEFSSARKALEVLRAGVQVDAVILDVLMPKLDGATTFQEIKKIAPGLPVILTSGLPAIDVGNRFPPNGRPKWFLHKPYGVSELLDVVGKALGKTSEKT